MKARKGFVATMLAVAVSLFLVLVSAYVFSLAIQTVREEAWSTSNMTRSLYPIAWSTTYFVLNSLSNDYPHFTGDASRVFLNRNSSSQPFPSSADKVISSFYIAGVASCDIDVYGNDRYGFQVVSTVSSDVGGVLREKTVRGVLAPDDGAWRILWR
jgi:hypothetical protein